MNELLLLIRNGDFSLDELERLLEVVRKLQEDKNERTGRNVN